MRVQGLACKLIDGQYRIVFEINGHGYMRMDSSVFANATFFFFLDLSKEKLCSILISGNVRR